MKLIKTGFLKTGLMAICVALASSAWAAPILEKVPGRPLAKDLTFTDLDGNPHKISEYRGKVVIVNYFETWCEPCQREMPSLNKAWDKVKGGDVVMLAISAKEKPETVREALKTMPINFTVLLDETGQAFNEWPVLAVPTTLVLDKEGRVTYRTVGERDWSDNAILRPVYQLELGRLVD